MFGDSLTVRCLLESVNMTYNIVYGVGRDQEMCAVAVLYSPMLPNMKGYHNNNRVTFQGPQYIAATDETKENKFQRARMHDDTVPGVKQKMRRFFPQFLPDDDPDFKEEHTRHKH